VSALTLTRRAALALALIAAGCGSEDGPTFPTGPSEDDRPATIRAFQAARERWRSQGYDSYSFRFERSCFCTEEYRAPARVRVAAGRIAEVTRLDTGATVPSSEWDRYRTIEGLFAEIEQALISGAWNIRATYHPALGHPTELYLDQLRDAVDEEVWYYAREVAPLR
jgi:hypothetical protein